MPSPRPGAAAALAPRTLLVQVARSFVVPSVQIKAGGGSLQPTRPPLKTQKQKDPGASALALKVAIDLAVAPLTVLAGLAPAEELPRRGRRYCPRLLPDTRRF